MDLHRILTAGHTNQGSRPQAGPPVDSERRLGGGLSPPTSAVGLSKLGAQGRARGSPPEAPNPACFSASLLPDPPGTVVDDRRRCGHDFPPRQPQQLPRPEPPPVAPARSRVTATAHDTARQIRSHPPRSHSARIMSVGHARASSRPACPRRRTCFDALQAPETRQRNERVGPPRCTTSGADGTLRASSPRPAVSGPRPRTRFT
jgi:hypothetical protein